MKKYIFLPLLLVFAFPLAAQAFSTTFFEQLAKDLVFPTAGFSILTSITGGGSSIAKPLVTVIYEVSVIRTDTGTSLSSGDPVPVGVELSFVPEPYNLGNAYYTETGWTGGNSVNAQWVDNASFPPTSLARALTSQCLTRDYLHSRVRTTSLTLGPFMCLLSAKFGTGCGGSLTITNSTYVDDYPPFSINPPTISIEHNGTAGLSCNGAGTLCTVTSAGTIDSDVIFSTTVGKFYHMESTRNQGDEIGSGICNVLSEEPLEEPGIWGFGSSGTPYIQTIPTTAVNVDLVAGTSECNDGIDNDGDGKTDYPADSDCSSGTDSSESPVTECNDGIDNDGNGKIDYPNDSGCVSDGDLTEITLTQCADGIDNNGNGLIDYPNDPACISIGDNNEETLPPASISLTVNSRLVAPGNSVTLSWTTEDVQEGLCVLSGTNGDSWSNLLLSGSHTSSGISNQTSFTLQCLELDGDIVNQSVTVKLTPRFQEI